MTARFDGATAWAALSSAAQAEIGATAIELVVAWHVQGRADEDADALGEGVAERLQRAGEAAEHLLFQLLRSSVNDHVGEAALDAEGTPLLPSLLGPVCRTCGCSEMDACQPFSCSWVGPDLCSACVPAEASA